MRRLADKAQKAFPQMNAHQHISDAASALDRGNPAAARRHLHAATAQFTPQSVSRHGLADDASHQAAQGLMGEVARHALLVKDVADAQDQDQAQLANQAQAIELARQAVGLSSGTAYRWDSSDVGGLPPIEQLTDTRPARSAGEVADAARESMGLGSRRVRPSDGPSVGALAGALGLRDG
jgi:hypothetical protein